MNDVASSRLIGLLGGSLSEAPCRDEYPLDECEALYLNRLS
jgi:hypothetical protein